MLQELSRWPRIAWLAPAAVAASGAFPMPRGYYGYYSVVHAVVFFACLSLAFGTYADRPSRRAWVIIPGFLALLFNPLVPFHLGKSVWPIVDIAAGVALLLHMHFVRGWSGNKDAPSSSADDALR